MKIYSLKIAGSILTCACFLALTTRADDTVTNSVAMTNAASRLVIVKAVYGDLSDPSSTSDVTEQVAGMVSDNALTVDATDDNFGDPGSLFSRRTTK